MSIRHPFVADAVALSEEVQQAVDYEIRHGIEQIDSWRESGLVEWVHRAAFLQREQRRWAENANAGSQELVSRIHGPWMNELSNAIAYEDSDVVMCCLCGFPYVGLLPPSRLCVRNVAPSKAPYSVDQLRGERKTLNSIVLGKVRESEFAHDLWIEGNADAEMGAMSPAVPLDTVDPSQISLSRRLAIRELRSKGWRTRPCDHKTESMINAATQPQDMIVHDILDVLALIVLEFFKAGVDVLMWKRDISKAFRRVPIASEHLDLSWVVFAFAGTTWVAQHTGMPFGTVSANMAWHRVGNLLAAIVRRAFLAPLGRYVDDYFGASRPGLKWTGGRILSIIAMLMGFPCDNKKDASDALEMIVLGAIVSVDVSQLAVRLAVDSIKAALWCRLLHQVRDNMHCESGLASKLAGRLSFAVCVANHRVGRAFIKAFHAQPNSPLTTCLAGPLLLQAVEWFILYLTVRPRATRYADTSLRPHIRTWVDASGEGRWIAAVMFCDGRWFWTRMKTPQALWDQLLPRGDHQIGFQELLSVLLAQQTFAPWLTRALRTSYGDNDGVLHALTHGSGGGPEVNLAVGHFWIECASSHMGWYGARMESKANIADGPTRNEFGALHALGAEWVVPKLPALATNLWRITAP